MTSPIEAAEAAIAADRAYADAAVWITRLPDEAIRERARVLQAEGPRGRKLWGMTFAVKDSIDIAGLPTTVACPGYAYVPDRTAPSVQRLLDAGALLLGKTNLDQFATGLVGVRSPYGVPRNPFDATRVPGGSSSGSAVAVAAGVARFALGTDTAGSGRVPAMFCNIVGLKPTIGSISATGLVPACQSIDTISVLAGTVDDALAVLRVIVGFDAADPYSRAAPFAHLRRGAAPPGARVAAVDASAVCAAPIAAAYARAVALLGAELVDIAPLLEVARLLYDGPWVAERSAAFRGVIERQPEILHPVTRAILESGLARRSVDAFDAFHALAVARRHAEALFAKYSAQLLPTAPFTPALAELEADGIGPNSRLGTYASFANLCDLAAIAVPAGFAGDGLPAGVMLVGPAWSEGRLAALADPLHRAMADSLGATGRALPPQAAPDPLGAEETALFCVGAHMSGLSLNDGLLRLGGRFVRVAATAPRYRLHALGGRAGMVRAESGGAIPGEVWAVPTPAIGALLATVVPPLGLGTVELEDGPCLGFLAEAAGVIGMRDITGFGGWRAYLATAALGASAS
jgi:allophanate hydrolase